MLTDKRKRGYFRDTNTCPTLDNIADVAPSLSLSLQEVNALTWFQHLIFYWTTTQSNSTTLDSSCLRCGFVMPPHQTYLKLTSNLPPKRKNGALRQEAYRCLPPSGDSEQMTRCMHRPRAKHDGTHDLRYFITCQFNLIIYSKERALVQSFSY